MTDDHKLTTDHHAPARLRKWIDGQLPDRVEHWLRYWLIPDESNLVYDILKDRAAERVMIDVGACIGGALRNFANDGWEVYAFEPDPVNREMLERRFDDAAWVHIDPRALSNEESSSVPFYRSDVSAGISGLSSFHESHTAAGTVETTTLGASLREEQITAIDFVKVDTEGYDLFVLQGTPWNATRPRVIVCEFEDAKSVPLGYTFKDLAAYLDDLDYHVLVSEWRPIVNYSGPHRWRRFGRYPIALADERAWGNLIAMRDDDDYARLLSASRALSLAWRFGAPIRRLLGSRA